MLCYQARYSRFIVCVLFYHKRYILRNIVIDANRSSKMPMDDAFLCSAVDFIIYVDVAILLYNYFTKPLVREKTYAQAG